MNAIPPKTIRPSWVSREGAAHPLGATYVCHDDSLNFSIYSRHAERVVLQLYAAGEFAAPCFTYELDPLHNKSGPVWHCRFPADQISDAQYYAYRMDGPAPAGGFEFHAFDFDKLLVDPYAHTIFFPPAFSRDAARVPGSNSGRAALGVLPKSRCQFEWGNDSSPRHESDLVIYEMHVGGFTKHPSSMVQSNRRGTFLAVCEKIPYLKELGVTAVELMPVFQFGPQEGNYWGYMPLSLFAPHHAYSTDPAGCQQRDEFRTMVKSLHAAGIEVIIDVVYNHTCEGNHLGPVYNLKGIDNSTYYVASGDASAPYANYSGTGNTLHTANRAVRQLIIDSMRYWVEEMHVDGFRFDLASIFTRNSDGSIDLSDPPIFGQIGTEDDLADIRLIAEPWDAAGVFQLGRSFPGMQWMQWNASFRDSLQRFCRGDVEGIGELMTRIYGSSDLFPDDRKYAYRPCQSINYVTSHDGMTMHDLVAFGTKNNWANGHDNADGHNDFSTNLGWEGIDNVPPLVSERRKQQIKNLFCLLLLSNGTPMFRMGDEFMQTQRGNSNPYNQDNETSWLNWNLATENADLLSFVQRMIAFRKRHPSISRSRFWRDDIKWYGTGRDVDFSPMSRCVAYCLQGASEHDCDLYVMINGSDSDKSFGIHEGAVGQWCLVIDTSRPSPKEFTEVRGQWISKSSHVAAANSIVVLSRIAFRL